MEMDIDSSAEMEALPHQSQSQSQSSPYGSKSSKAAAALSLLEEGLRPFIHSAVKAALGEDMYSFYLPSEKLSCAGLLRYIRKKWLGVFCDTALEPFSAVIDRLAHSADMICASQKSNSSIATDSIFEDVQTVLVAIRKHGLAAKVAHISHRGHSTLSEPLGLSTKSQEGPVNDFKSFADAHRPSASNAETLLTSNFINYIHSSTDCALIEPGTVSALPPMPVALDGSNIAWRHGNSKRFSFRGIVEALLYFAERGHPSVVFLPEGRMRSVASNDTSEFEGELEAFAALKTIEGTPQLVLTPGKDYDDSYLTHFAREYQAVVVSNDTFADQVYQAHAESAEAAEDWRRWLGACRLSFTFHGHAFVPNPTFDFRKASEVAAKLKKVPSAGSQ